MIFTSPYPDIEIPPVTLTDFVLEHSAEYGDKPALIDSATGAAYTHAGLRKCHPSGRRRPRRARHRQGRRRRALRRQRARVRDRLPRHRAPSARSSRRSTRSTPSTSSPSSSSTRGRARSSAHPRASNRARDAAGRAGVEELYVFGETDGATPFAALLDGDPGRPVPDTPAGRRPRRAAVLERHDGPPQGRDAHPPQPRRQRRCSHRSACP